MNYIFLTHIFITFFMTGLCWFVQVVHYPLFKEIPLDKLPNYERKNAVTAYITVPLMIVELMTGMVILYFNPEWVYLINVFLMGVIGLSTFMFQVPIHLKLMHWASPDLINKVTQTNWIRTVSWTIRSGVLFYVLMLKL